MQINSCNNKGFRCNEEVYQFEYQYLILPKSLVVYKLIFGLVFLIICTNANYLELFTKICYSLTAICLLRSELLQLSLSREFIISDF